MVVYLFFTYLTCLKHVRYVKKIKKYRKTLRSVSIMKGSPGLITWAVEAPGCGRCGRSVGCRSGRGAAATSRCWSETRDTAAGPEWVEALKQRAALYSLTHPHPAGEPPPPRAAGMTVNPRPTHRSCCRAIGKRIKGRVELTIAHIYRFIFLFFFYASLWKQRLSPPSSWEPQTQK